MAQKANGITIIPPTPRVRASGLRAKAKGNAAAVTSLHLPMWIVCWNGTRLLATAELLWIGDCDPAYITKFCLCQFACCASKWVDRYYWVPNLPRLGASTRRPSRAASENFFLWQLVSRAQLFGYLTRLKNESSHHSTNFQAMVQISYRRLRKPFEVNSCAESYWPEIDFQWRPGMTRPRRIDNI